MKTCSKCLVEKDKTEFFSRKAGKEGLDSYCRYCRSISNAVHYKANSEKAKAYSIAWRKENPERSKATQDYYRAANAEKVKASCAAWRQKNPEKALAASAAWKKSNPEKVKSGVAAYRAAYPERVKSSVNKWQKANLESRRINEQNYRSRKSKNGGKLSQGLAAKLFKLQRGKCPCCQKPLGSNYHL